MPARSPAKRMQLAGKTLQELGANMDGSLICEKSSLPACQGIRMFNKQRGTVLLNMAQT
ncbi:hypothetical protein NYE70_01480 [Paenibacillus sp. FSL R5-0407]|uniref:hypothetical protein n=1 Tax=Paenibacillus sp. FSL R5-0407 TaxID=2975320 RepID=UPI0030F8B72E